MRLQRRERWLIGLAAGASCVGFVLVALAYANEWWLSAIMTASIAAWLAGVVWAVYCRPGERVLALGAVIAGFLYILLALGPWFQTNIGPWLLTTRAFHYLETKWLKPDSPPQGMTFNVPWFYSGGYGDPNSIFISGSGVMPGYPQMGGATYVVNTPTVSGPSAFAAVGHWLAAWACAGGGAVVAGWIARRRNVSSSTTGPGENPFREVLP
jgi:hypothetical protein